MNMNMNAPVIIWSRHILSQKPKLIHHRAIWDGKTGVVFTTQTVGTDMGRTLHAWDAPESYGLLAYVTMSILVNYSSMDLLSWQG